MHEVLVNCLGGLSLPKKSVVRLTDCPDMTIDVYHGRKTTTTDMTREGSDQTANMCSLINTFTCHQCHIVGNHMIGHSSILQIPRNNLGMINHIYP